MLVHRVIYLYPCCNLDPSSDKNPCWKHWRKKRVVDMPRYFLTTRVSVNTVSNSWTHQRFWSWKHMISPRKKPFMIFISWVLNHLILSSIDFVGFPQDETRLGTPGGRSLGTASHQHVLSFLGIQNGTVQGSNHIGKGRVKKTIKKRQGIQDIGWKFWYNWEFFGEQKLLFFELVGFLWDFARKFDRCLFRGLEHGKLRCESFDDATKKIHYWLHPLSPLRKIDNIGFGNTNTIKHTSPEDPCIFACIYHKFKPIFW